MEQHKVRTYILYALGEILLVMIGILLALQVNNWNEQRITYEKEKYILNQLRSDFLKNLESIQNSKDFNLGTVSSGEEILKFIQLQDPELVPPAELDSLLGIVVSNYTQFDPANGAIQDLLNSGKLDIIQNDSLRYLISQWSSILEDIDQDYVIRNNQIDLIFTPYVLANFPFLNSKKYGITDPYNVRPLLVEESVYHTSTENIMNMQFESIIYNYILNQQYVLNEEYIIEDYVVRLLNFIDREIGQLD